MASCKDPAIVSGCGDTTLEGGDGATGIGRVFPDDAVSELQLWDSIAQEPAKLSGTPFRLWSVRRARNLHPLYREPSNAGFEWEFHGPWEMMGAFEFDQGNEIDPEVSAEGLQKTSTSVLYIARKELEDIDAPEPKIGDVIDLWDRMPFGSEFQYWDVTKANPDGNVMTSEVFVQYRLEMKRRSRFEPGRKALGTRI